MSYAEKESEKHLYLKNKKIYFHHDTRYAFRNVIFHDGCELMSMLEILDSKYNQGLTIFLSDNR